MGKAATGINAQFISFGKTWDDDQELSEDNVVCRQQPNLNSNCQYDCVKSKDSFVF